LQASPLALLTPVGQATPSSWTLPGTGGSGALTFSLASTAAHGTAVVNGNGTFTYTPGSGYSGSDSFQYRVTDGLGETSISTVSVGVGSAGYRVAQSLQFVASQPDYLTQTPSAAGNQTTWTWGGWVDPGSSTGTPMDIFTTTSGSGSNVLLASLRLNSNGQLEFYDYSAATNGYSTYIQTTQQFSSNTWCQVTLVYDTTQAVAANRAELFVNGQQITSFSIQTDPSQNTAGTVNRATSRYIGYEAGNSRPNYFNGNMADVQFVDGQALSGAAFGTSVNGQWEPIAYSGSYGRNGYHLTFAPGSIGADTSGNGDNFTPVNLGAANVSSASPGGTGLQVDSSYMASGFASSDFSGGAAGPSSTTDLSQSLVPSISIPAQHL
jgi:hypothetical protein